MRKKGEENARGVPKIVRDSKRRGRPEKPPTCWNGRRKAMGKAMEALEEAACNGEKRADEAIAEEALQGGAFTGIECAKCRYVRQGREGRECPVCKAGRDAMKDCVERLRASAFHEAADLLEKEK